MQKFKVSKEEFRKALKDISDWGFVSIELEGELLEGGTVERTGFELDNGTNPNTFQCANTVEKCCNHDRPEPFTCYCPCHNKKEACNACSMQGKNAEWCHFNRETPKSVVTISERIESILERFEVKPDRAAAALRDIATDFRDAKAHETN